MLQTCFSNYRGRKGDRRQEDRRTGGAAALAVSASLGAATRPAGIAGSLPGHHATHTLNTDATIILGKCKKNRKKYQISIRRTGKVQVNLR